MHTKRPQRTGRNKSTGSRSYRWVVGLLLGLLGGGQPGQAADFTCPAGDVACLIAAITTANGNGQANTITLAGGTFDDPQAYTLIAVDNTTDGPNGLPSITSVLVITGQRGEDESRPTIEREPGAPPFRLLHVAATGNLTLHLLRLEGGLIDANDGGGIFNLGTLTLTTSTLSFNTAGRDSGGGGGLANFGGTVTLTNSSLASNTTYGGGGGLGNFGGTVTLTNSSLARNTAYGSGGGLYNSGTLTLINSTLDSNTAYSDGGGIFNNGTSAILTLTDSTLTHNTSSGHGGGISNFASGTQTLTNTTLYDNRAGNQGGGIWAFSGAPQTLTNVTLLHNTSDGNGGGANGGGIAILNGTLTLTNSTLAFNTAYARAAYARDGTDIVNGGGIGNFGGTLMLINSTLAFNTAYGTTGGGGIESSSVFSGSTTLQNTLLALNTAPDTLSPSRDCVGAVTSNGNNLIGDPADCTITLQASDLTGDPGLDAFTDDFTPGHGHFPLLATSQAINAGNDAACPPTDQLGQPRVDQCDIGAIEFQPSDTTPPVITVSATPEILWPPNGKLVPVTLVATITDAGVGVDPSTTAYAVEDEYGSVEPSGALTLGQDGRYTATIPLQASRNGNDANGRLYTIIVYAQDNEGNERSASAIVTVPHDLGQGRSSAAR